MSLNDRTGPWLSIITVVKDELGGLERTAESIARQQALTESTPGIEWVVIDSSTSARECIALVSKYPEISSRYEWTPPAGVYPAMNTGLKYAWGDYAIFLNAGDEFFDASSVTNIRHIIDRDQPTWMFGQVCFVSETGSRVTPPPLDYPAEQAAHFSRGRFPPHQGTIACRQALLDLGGFDTSYSITADYAMFLKLSLRQEPSISHAIIAMFHEGGLSTQSWRESHREFHRARREMLHLSGRAAVTEWLNTYLGVVKATIYRRLMR